ncbi:MAG: hypothetical protein JXA53_01825, partial [Bacteroidales bacterium]|nr:hypothetical protein [Bacteroidales bacterium]
MKWTVLMSKRKLYHLTFLPGLEGLSYRYDRAYYKWENGYADVMAIEKEVKEKQKELVKVIYSDPFWPEMFTEWAIRKLDITPDYAKNIFKLDYSKLSNKQLLKHLKVLHEKMNETIKTVIFLNIDTLIQSELEDYLIQHVTDKKELLEVIECITAPTRISSNIEQQ